MSDTQAVRTAIQNGADQHMLCETCPWDRFCITPPSMTAGDVEAGIEKARTEAEQDGGEGRFIGMMFSALVLGGRDTQATICPVLADRMKTSDGRRIVDAVRDMMQGWVD